jgi:hypothetical protein
MEAWEVNVFLSRVHHAMETKGMDSQVNQCLNSDVVMTIFDFLPFHLSHLVLILQQQLMALDYSYQMVRMPSVLI